MTALKEVLLWLLVFQLVSIASSPIIAYALPRSVDRGYGASKTLGLLLLGYCVWLPSYFGVTAMSSGSAWLLLVVLFGAAQWIIIIRFGSWRRFFAGIRDHVICVELLFLAGFVLFAAQRSATPEIFWGEKPMDFTFLNYFIRLEHLPPDDPWAAGQKMGYYYFGTYLIALLHKLSGVDSAYGYNLSIATLCGMMLTGVYSIIVTIWRKRRFAVVGALAVILISNFDVMNLALLQQPQPPPLPPKPPMPADFHLFWATSRVLSSPGINEYPLWSLLFADLHAHVIALPVTVALLALGIRFAATGREKLSGSYLVHRGLYAVSWGSLFLLNTWDFLTYSLITASWFVFKKADRRKGRLGFRNLLRDIRSRLASLCAVFLLVSFVLAPFLTATASTAKAYTGWVTGREFNTVYQIFRHFGLWIIFFLAGILAIFWRAILRRIRAFMSVGMDYGLPSLSRVSAPYAVLRKIVFTSCCVLCGSIVPIMAAKSYYDGSKNISWAIVAVSSAGVILTLLATLRRRAPLPLRAGGVLLSSAFFILGVVELVFLMDRMNTVFKFYNALWILFGIGACAVLPYWSTSICRRSRHWLFLFPRFLCGIILCAVAAVGLSGSALNIYIMSNDVKIKGPRPTLDGMAYLEEFDSDEAALIHWIRENIPETPTILEAQERSYEGFTRIAMHTGLPTVLGWDYHVLQRGTPQSQISARRQDIKTIYNTTSVELALSLLRRYSVAFIVVSGLEMSGYLPAGLNKFSQNSQSFPLLFRKGHASLYGVIYPKSGGF